MFQYIIIIIININISVVPRIWRQTGENRLLSSQIDCWVSFILVQMSHSGSVKLEIHPPGRLGVFHSYGGRPMKIVLSHLKLTSESYCVLVQMSHLHPVELHVPPPTNSPCSAIQPADPLHSYFPVIISRKNNISCLYK